MKFAVERSLYKGYNQAHMKLTGSIFILGLLMAGFIAAGTSEGATDENPPEDIYDTATADSEDVTVDYTANITKEDILKLGQKMYETGQLNRQLTQDEADLFARNYEKMGRLKEIADHAELEAHKAHSADINVPEDAYRHVLWSYLLTKEYGPEFALQVTNAREQGDNTNTPAEHRQDYNNNKVGISYAKKGYEEKDILKRVMEDPKVIRYVRRTTYK